MKKTVGINQRISVRVIEMAMKAALDGNFSSEYAEDLAFGEYEGTNRINKARSIIGKLSVRNPLFNYIEEHKQLFNAAMKHRGDRAIIFTSLINAAYVFGYDAMVILGKFFHVQDEVSSQLIINRMSSIYASNRSLPNGLYCIMPMYIEAGLLNRPKTGIYTRNYFENLSSFTIKLYKQSFIVHNPMIQIEDTDSFEHPYFEFLL
ncbi:MAG: hypothetical protein SOR57_09765 [Parabacteroides sp.]|nr:hypothetical protein [Parabacteroides sp.]